MMTRGTFIVVFATVILLAAGCAETQHYLRDAGKFMQENVKFTTDDPLDPNAPGYWTDYMSQQGGG